MDDLIGWIVGIVIVGVVFGIMYSVTLSSDPCTQYNIQWRQTLIEAHERCMVEENCIYKDWDIRKYDSRLAQRAICETRQ